MEDRPAAHVASRNPVYKHLIRESSESSDLAPMMFILFEFGLDFCRGTYGGNVWDAFKQGLEESAGGDEGSAGNW